MAAITITTAPPGGDPLRSRNRRGIVGALAAFATGGIAGAAGAASANPDARLIAMCAELVARNDAQNVENSIYWDRGIDPPEAVFLRHCATTPAYHRLKARIAITRAATPAGVQAKARAILSHAGDRPSPEADDAMGWSLAEDLASIGGAA